MELHRKVRLACRDGISERAAARHFGVSRQSVRKMLCAAHAGACGPAEELSAGAAVPGNARFGLALIATRHARLLGPS